MNTATPAPHIRFFRKADRATVRALCADTGFLGSPIDPVFEDRELFANYLTAYYTDWEPESTLVLEIDNQICGYLTGCRHPRRKKQYEMLHGPIWVLKGIARYFFKPYSPASKKYVRWILSSARKQTPAAPPNTPHFHINLLPHARNVANTRQLIDTFLNYLAGCGEKAVYGQVVTFENRRSPRTFARYGFEVVDEREVTKYRDFTDQKVYLYTIIKDLTRNTSLYGLDLKQELESQNDFAAS